MDDNSPAVFVGLKKEIKSKAATTIL